ncbi:related to LSM1 - Sm-like (Lsm) protein [Melanopsichium pennsylvanicum]|uniref:U6 snRNA-associated Sm-like protein LSm1 n=2 Tax=Melanopsichium pennsylvanicum TaxID=63383 RepID=A0AAJ4XST2_9BASI|nr:related to LSM1-Sm-like (Lsm) protein [Melanopsichium pennsylvanicum 4]SNX87311.1 related to LSM1 - Sm-like (Lsm) protein [Melanopsichium pennsylvanicum]
MDAQDIVSNIAFTTSGSLVDCVDKKMLVVLRDGKKLIGVLRSYDQFANLVLQDTVERVFVGNRYGDIARGVFLVRGENVVLMGEIDLDAEDEVPLSIAAPLPPSALPQLFAAKEAETESKAKSEAKKADILRLARGFCADKSGDGDMY